MLIHMVQHFAAGFGHDDKILHAHAKLARQVYARLNGEDHARLYGIGVGGAHIALFVVAEYIDNEYKKAGCESVAFTTIVSFGANAADPHHEPDDTVLEKGECVLIDMGCCKNRYCSDMTRTFFCQSEASTTGIPGHSSIKGIRN